MSKISRRESLRAIGGAFMGGLFENAKAMAQEKTEVERLSEKAKRLESFLKGEEIPKLLTAIRAKLDAFKLGPGHMMEPIEVFEQIYKRCLSELENLTKYESQIADLKKTLTDPDQARFKASSQSLLEFYESFRLITLKAIEVFHDYVISGRFVETGETLTTGIKIEGFEKLPGWNNERIRKIIAEMPTGFFEGVEAIKYSQDTLKGETYEAAASAGSKTKMSLRAFSFLGQEQKDIVIYKYDKPVHDFWIEEILAHEGAHHLDWTRSYRLNFKQRLQFFSEILDLYTSTHKIPNRYPDERVYEEYKKQREKDKDQPLEQLLSWQAREYWGDLVHKYFRAVRERRRSPEDFSFNSAELSQAEFEFIERWLSVQGVDIKYKY